MPSVSNKQKRLMAAAAHNPEFAKEAGIDQDVAREFHSADKKEDKKKTKPTNEVRPSIIKKWGNDGN